ncbi:NYN domain-containing protein [Verminephrobacter eiseniae]|nr:NYN domain-containing protein [Verminephrobacter eiseniae]
MVWARLWQEKYPAPCPTWRMAIERQKQMAAAGLSFAHRPALWTVAPAFGHIYFRPGWPGPSLSVRARPTPAPAPGGLSIFGRAKMNRFVVMVDADYLFRQAIDIVSNRASTSRADLDIVDPAGLIEALLDKSRSTLDLTRKELLRVYWYDGVMANGFTPQQRSLANIDDVQFRAGTINGRDQQRDIASLIATDLLELAGHHAICDAVLVTGDSDLAVGIDMAKKRGVRIAVLGVEDPATGVARHRSAEIACRADRVGLLGQAELAQALRYAPSGQSAPAQQSVAASGQAIDLIDRVRIEAAVKAFIDQQTAPLTGTVNHAAKRIDANVDRSLLFHVLTELGHGRLTESEKIYARHVFRAEV